MGYKYYLYGGSSGSTRDNPSTNGVVFATADEAARARNELFSRWFGCPPDFFVEQVDEEPNYTFPADASRPQRIEETPWQT